MQNRKRKKNEWGGGVFVYFDMILFVLKKSIIDIRLLFLLKDFGAMRCKNTEIHPMLRRLTRLLLKSSFIGASG